MYHQEAGPDQKQQQTLLPNKGTGTIQDGLPATTVAQPFSPTSLLQLQQTVGNTAVQHLMRQSNIVQRCGGHYHAGYSCVKELAGPEQYLLQRLPLDSPTHRSRPTPAPTPTPGLAATPAAPLNPLPTTVQGAHAARLAAGDLDGALQVIVTHMESQGEIDTSILAPATAVSPGAAVCGQTAVFSVEPSLGASAVTTKCTCTGTTGQQQINVRVQIGPGAISRSETLHSTLYHEFRHVRQEHELCNSSGTTSSFGGLCTDCNQPDEMDAYLAEIEAGYDPQAIRRAWVRVYVNWPWLAPEQQAIFMGRQTAARLKVDSLFPQVDWDADARVNRYNQWCWQLDQQIGGNTAGTCDNPLAPLHGPGPRPGLPIPEPPPPQGDFPLPDRDERVA
jgi:hypothetical protein